MSVYRALLLACVCVVTLPGCRGLGPQVLESHAAALPIIARSPSSHFALACVKQSELAFQLVVVSPDHDLVTSRFEGSVVAAAIADSGEAIVVVSNAATSEDAKRRSGHILSVYQIDAKAHVEFIVKVSGSRRATPHNLAATEVRDLEIAGGGRAACMVTYTRSGDSRRDHVVWMFDLVTHSVRCVWQPVTSLGASNASSRSTKVLDTQVLPNGHYVLMLLEGTESGSASIVAYEAHGTVVTALDVNSAAELRGYEKEGRRTGFRFEQVSGAGLVLLHRSEDDARIAVRLTGNELGTLVLRAE